MKKVLALALALILVCMPLALTSCDILEDMLNSSTKKTLDGMTPEEIYVASQARLKEATMYSVEATQTISMSYMEESQNIKQTVSSKVNGEDSYIKVYNELDPDLNMEAWYVDGTVYASMAGVKAKAVISKSDFMQKYMNADPSEGTLLDIPKSWFEDIRFEKDGESWVLNFDVSGEKYTELLENTDTEGEINGNVAYKIYFDKDGNLEKVYTSFDMSIGSVQAHCDSISLVTLEDITITAPADADDYITAKLP